MKAPLVSFPLLCALFLASNVCLAQVGELSTNSIRGYLEDFRKADVDGSGLLEEEELTTYLASFPEAMKQLLTHLTKDDQGVTSNRIMQAATHFKRLKGYDPRVEPSKKKEFARWDANSDGKLTQDELNQIGPSELREILQAKLTNQEALLVTDYLDGFGKFIRALEVKRTAADEALPQKYQANDPLRQKLAAFLAVTDAKKKSSAPADVVEVVKEVNEVVEPVGEHAEYFQHFDKDGNGVLEGEEILSLPQMLNLPFMDGRQVKPDVQITLEQFSNALNLFRKQAIVARERTAEEARFQQYRRKFLSANPTTKETVAANEEDVAVVEEVTTTERLQAKLPAQVEIMLLRRKSEKLPPQTFSEEVLHVAGKAGPALSARLLPWLADEKNENAQLLDYLLVTVSEDGQARVQRGGREPYVQGSSSRGAVSYNTHNVGTLVVVAAKPTEDGTVMLSIQFEKSFVEPTDVSDDDDKPSVPPEVKPNYESAPEGAPLSGSEQEFIKSLRVSVIHANSAGGVKPIVPPTIATMEISGTLTVRPGEPAVLSETGQFRGGIYDESLILVEIKP
ncbi:hypothetical protein [Blastopirellula marina]|uniref:EF-hand domain-containing protein n=1 Tax=Blastopirellula marina TaxID=124 RepID=A0A2S8G187_9BACT|nr:hypothetical protein [Blastopirellula marina]PQO38209.1 hypothetical protein C5Y98_09060 [Blastopirellula marina]